MDPTPRSEPLSVSRALVAGEVLRCATMTLAEAIVADTRRILGDLRRGVLVTR